LNSFIHFNQLNKKQLDQYIDGIAKAFPQLLSESPIIKRFWSKLEQYYPEHQHFLISPEGELIGFINTVPFQLKERLDELPDEGWDWMLTKGISDFENKQEPNLLGGLQVIVREEFQNLGYSRQIIKHCKEVLESSKLLNLVIPIRPTKKHLFPTMSMTDYMNYKKESEIFDPWIRTHLKGGAQIVKVCERSMTIKGDIGFWEKIMNKKITKSGDHILDGALHPIRIDLKNNIGEYREPNIWIKYS